MDNEKNKLRISITQKIGVLSIVLLFLFIPNGKCATVDDDPKEDHYSISMLSFFYILGSDFEDEPDSIEPFAKAIEDLIEYSTETTSHSEIDIREVIYETEDGFAIIGVEFEEDIDDDDILILGIGEHDGNMFSFTIETNSTNVADCTYTSEATGDSNETLAWIVGDQIAFYCNEEDFEWERGDDLIVLALTMPDDFSDFREAMSSHIYWDFAPNEDVSDDPTTYQGTDLITQFLDLISSFLFGFLPGGLSFKFFMALLMVLGQVFLDRKKKWMRYSGMIFLMLLYYPLIQYTIALDFSTTIIGINYISIVELLILLNMMLYIAFALMVSFGVLRVKNMFFFTSSGLMISETVLFLTLFNSGGDSHVIALIFLVFALAGLLVAIILSRKYGRTPKS